MQIRLEKPGAQLCHSQLSGQCNEGHRKITGFSPKSILKNHMINIYSVVIYQPLASVSSLKVLSLKKVALS